MPASAKLYRAMAETIKKEQQDTTIAHRLTILMLTEKLCDDLKQDNIHFDRQKFLTACGFPY